MSIHWAGDTDSLYSFIATRVVGACGGHLAL